MDNPFSFELTKFICSFNGLLYLHKLVGYALEIVSVAEVRRKLLKLVSSYLFLAPNTGMEAEDATPTNLFLFSDKLVEHESTFKYVFRGEFEVSGSLAEEVGKTTSPIELVSVTEIELEVEWTEFAFRTALLEDSEEMCTTS